MRLTAPLTSHSLRSPDSPIQALAGAFGQWLHFPDPEPLYLLLGAVAANMLEGEPVWVMMIGPPGCGKTTLLRSLLSIPHFYETGPVTGASALLSATPKRERETGATGGLLREVGEAGALVWLDFTGVLDLPETPLKELLGGLREAHSGGWTRPVGTGGGHRLRWEGRLACFAGSTPSIDQFARVSAEMGERWVYYRWPKVSTWAQSRKAAGGIRDIKEMQAVVQVFIETLNLAIDHPLSRRQLTDSEVDRIVELATFSSMARSGVSRHWYTREVIGVDESEFPGRLAACLSQLYLGLEVIGIEQSDRWPILVKVALDSMPQVRRKVLECLWERNGSLATADQVEQCLMCSPSTVKRTLEDLLIHGVVERTVNGHGPKLWGVSRRAKELSAWWRR